MSQFTIYRSTDASAPQLSGQTGKLVDILDACLVNGYGAKAAAGWEIVYTGTSKRVYRAASGLRHYFRVQNDSISAGLTYKAAILAGYETMSSIDVGTRMFPIESRPIVIGNSRTADATAVPWIIYADAKTCYIFTLGTQSALATTAWAAHMFGEFESYVTGDAYYSMVGGLMPTAGLTAIGISVFNSMFYDTYSVTPDSSMDYGRSIPRGWTQLGSSPIIMLGFPLPTTFREANVSGGYYQNLPGGGLHAYPSAGSIVLYPFEIKETTNQGDLILRGKLRGCWAWGHSYDFLSHEGIYTSTGGRTFQCIKPIGFASATSAYYGGLLMETSNTI